MQGNVILKSLEPEPTIKLTTGELPDDSPKETEEVKEAKTEEEKPKEQGTEPDPEPKPDPEKEKFQRRFDALSKRERELVHKERRYKDLDKKLKELEEFKTSFESNPYEILDKKGITLEAYAKHILEQPEDEVNPEKREVKEIREEINKIKEEKRKEQEYYENAERQRVYNSELQKIGGYISEKVDEYPIVNLFDQGELIFNTRAEKYAQDAEAYGQEYANENLLSVEEATTLVEEHFMDRLKENKKAISALINKLKAIGEDGEEEKPKEDEDKKEESEEVKEEAKKPDSFTSPINKGLPDKTKRLLGMRTLTNNQQTTVPVPTEKKFSSEVEKINSIAEKYL